MLTAVVLKRKRSRQRILLGRGLAVVLVMFLCLEACASHQDRPPNVVIIMADDLGYGDLSAYGGWIETPHLDSLAAEGMRLTDFHASAPVCSPTRAGLLTGRYQHRAGIPGVIFANPNRNRHHGLQPDEFTLADMMQQEGYATGLFGKWHLGYHEQYNPTRRGFDEFTGFVSGNVDYFTHVDGAGIYDWWEGRKKVQEPGYSTHLITEHAVDFVERQKDEPFLLYVAHAAPHFPFQGPGSEPIRKIGQGSYGPRDTSVVRPRYKTMVQEMDKGIGRLLETLRRHDLDENTLVFFFSDNGPLPYGSAGRFRGGKGTVFEGGHRVPGIAWWPGQIEPGSESDVLSTSLDLMPTIAALIGTEPPEGHAFDGMNLLPVLLENKQPEEQRTLFWEMEEQQAVREGPWKLVRDARGQEGVALYNLVRDADESNDLSATYPARVDDMLSAWETWKEEVTSDAATQPPKVDDEATAQASD